MAEYNTAMQEALAFEVWMRETVQTIHYADNDKMSQAYDRVFNNSLEIKIYESNKR